MSDIVYEKNVFSMPFLSGYSELRMPIVDSDGNPAWPAVFPIQKIEQIRQTVGERHFSAQMMLEFVPPDRVRLDPGGIKFYDDEFDSRTAQISDNLITGACIYWDPSCGRKTGDNSVCVLVYRDDTNRRVFIHDIMYMIVPDEIDYPLAYQCDLVLNFVRRHKMRILMVETNGLGNALPEIMRNTISQSGYDIKIHPVTNSRHKEDRIIDAIEPLLSTGRLYAHQKITQTPFVAEMLSWSPIGGTEHDDGLDALSGAITAIPVPVRPSGVGLRQYSANTNFNI